MLRLRRDASPFEIVAALETNFYAFLPHFGCQPETELHREDDATWFLTRLDSTLFNQVIRSRFSAENADRRIAELCAAFEERGGPFLWWQTPSCKPPDLGDRLETRGFQLQEQWPGMALSLEELPQDGWEPSGFRAEEVQARSGLRAWLTVFAESFHIDAMLTRRFLTAWGERLDGPSPPFRFFLGHWHGEPAATALLFGHAGVAGLYCVSTRPACRRLGVGKAMTRETLNAATADGHTFAVLQATSMGLSLYEALGFRRCCEFRYYFRQDEMGDDWSEPVSGSVIPGGMPSAPGAPGPAGPVGSSR